MAVKKLVLGILGFVGISVICTGCFLKKENSTDIENTLSEKKTTTQVATKQENIKKHDLYSEAIYDLPLFSIVEISTLPNELKNTIDKDFIV